MPASVAYTGSTVDTNPALQADVELKLHDAFLFEDLAGLWPQAV
jgi:hypothetical protein